ncbi:MAG: hypothetical protein AB7H66_10610 [Hyphomonadaceae bacterium]
MTTTGIETRPQPMNVVHALVVGAAVTAFLLTILWATEAAGVLPLSPDLRGLLFQTGERGPAAPLYDLGFTIAFGAIVGASIAIFANLLSFLDRR